MIDILNLCEASITVTFSGFIMMGVLTSSVVFDDVFDFILKRSSTSFSSIFFSLSSFQMH